MKNKFIVILTMFVLMITIISPVVSAVTGEQETNVKTKKDVVLSKVEDNVCEILIGGDGKLVKKLISVEDSTKEAILQIDITNNRDREIENKNSEIMLVVDNSDSMVKNKIGDQTRKEVIYNATKNLATSLLNGNNNSSIGLVQFSTHVERKSDGTTDYSKEGYIDDAKLLLPLTKNSASINSAIDSIVADGPRTNIDAGLQVAKSSFSSENNNKYLILLTDGVPNTTVNDGKTVGLFTDEVVNKTKQTLKEIKDSGINIITVMTGVQDSPIRDGSGTTKTYKQYAEEIFGTSENSFYGKFYYVTDQSVAQTITNNVYADVTIVRENNIENIVVKDYFPADIINNYDFELIGQANIGTVTTVVNKEDNSITWTIEKLGPGQTATIKYKLKLKDNFDNKIINKVTNTNEKVDVTYIDTKGEVDSRESKVSPSIILRGIDPTPEPKVEPKEEPKEDPTIAPEPIPQTGVNFFMFVIVIGTFGGIMLHSIDSLKRLK